MTAQLSREIIENLLQHNDESDSPANAEAWEVNALCRLALAGMESDKNSRIAEALESLMWPNMAIGNKAAIKAAIDALRAAPPAPVAADATPPQRLSRRCEVQWNPVIFLIVVLILLSALHEKGLIW